MTIITNRLARVVAKLSVTMCKALMLFGSAMVAAGVLGGYPDIIDRGAMGFLAGLIMLPFAQWAVQEKSDD